ncbi:MAG: hypothetical protein HPY57_14815 [Ignavibacteria bacterium]|nr:hypothetical protein [Ignavibacteria bacterium]
MADHINGSHRIPLYVPNIYKNQPLFAKNCVYINVDVIVTEKFSRSVKIEYIISGNKFTDIIYLPVNKSIEYIVNTLNDKLSEKINKWLAQNNQTFVENEYKIYIDDFKKSVIKSIENLNKERIRTHREQKLNRINGRI